MAILTGVRPRVPGEHFKGRSSELPSCANRRGRQDHPSLCEPFAGGRIERTAGGRCASGLLGDAGSCAPRPPEVGWWSSCEGFHRERLVVAILSLLGRGVACRSIRPGGSAARFGRPLGGPALPRSVCSGRDSCVVACRNGLSIRHRFGSCFRLALAFLGGPRTARLNERIKNRVETCALARRGLVNPHVRNGGMALGARADPIDSLGATCGEAASGSLPPMRL